MSSISFLELSALPSSQMPDTFARVLVLDLRLTQDPLDAGAFRTSRRRRFARSGSISLDRVLRV